MDRRSSDGRDNALSSSAFGDSWLGATTREEVKEVKRGRM